MYKENLTYRRYIDKINSFDGTPKVIEALWDGDTSGWFLVLYVILEKKGLLFKHTSREQVGVITNGGDIRIFQGKVPPYPESEIANAIGKYFIDLHGTELYFPSPNHPDDDCPAYDQRHRGINCADCEKLIIPTTSQYLPKNICYNCHLVRKRNKKIIVEEPYDEGIHIYLNKGGEFQSFGYYGDIKYLPIWPFIDELVKTRKTEDPISIVTLDTKDLIQIKINVEAHLDKLILEHKDPPDHLESKFNKFKFVEFKKKKYQIMTRFNAEHEMFSKLISSYDQLEKYILEGTSYLMYFKNGITTRDDSILRFIKYIGKGKSTLKQLSERYIDIIDTDQISKSVRKLENFDCVIVKKDIIEITQNGKNIV